MDPDAVGRVERVPHGGSDDADLLDFSANTNPRRPPGVAGVFESALAVASAYPGSERQRFAEAAAAYLGCEPASVVPTAGASEAIRLAVETTLSAGDSALVPSPSFSEYAREVRLQGADPAFVSEEKILTTDAAALAEHDLAIVCNPNNPTGRLYADADLRAFAAACRRADTTLLVDEAFLDYADAPSLAGEPGVVVARSLTKVFGLPGLRMGFAVATEGELARLERAVEPWNLGTPAALVGEHCLGASEFVEATRERVERERAWLRERLSGAFDVADSDAPFLLLDTGERGASEVVSRARERGVAVRDATTFRGLDSHVRVAVKEREANRELCRALLGE